ncbi:MAG: hypothetical protein WC702_01870 [Patescibacteria group bacterium]|jgi:hypothetical protein
MTTNPEAGQPAVEPIKPKIETEFLTSERIYQRFEAVRDKADASVEERITAAMTAIKELQNLISYSVRNTTETIKGGPGLLSDTATRSGGSPEADIADRLKAGCASWIDRAEKLAEQAKVDLAKILAETIQSNREETIKVLEKKDPGRKKKVPANPPVTVEKTEAKKPAEVSAEVVSNNFKDKSFEDLMVEQKRLEKIGPGPEFVAVSEELSRRYEEFLSETEKKMKGLSIGELRKRLSELKKMESEEKNEYKLLTIRGELNIAEDVLEEKEKAPLAPPVEAASTPAAPVTEAIAPEKISDPFWKTVKGRQIIKEMKAEITEKISEVLDINSFVKERNSGAIDTVQAFEKIYSYLKDKIKSDAEAVKADLMTEDPASTRGKFNQINKMTKSAVLLLGGIKDELAKRLSEAEQSGPGVLKPLETYDDPLVVLGHKFLSLDSTSVSDFSGLIDALAADQLKRKKEQLPPAEAVAA